MEFLRKLIYRNIDIDKLSDEITKRRVSKLYKLARVHKSSRFYEQAEVHNHQKNPEIIRIGSNTHIRGKLLVYAYGGEISIGEWSFVGEGSCIYSGDKIKIGNHVLISHNVNLVDTNSHEVDAMERVDGYKHIITRGHPKEKGSIMTAPIVIEDHVWINFNAIILKGVTVGEGAIVAAGAVVTKNVEPFTLVAGNPARFVKNLPRPRPEIRPDLAR